MLLFIFVVVIAVVLLVSIDRVSCEPKADGRGRNAVDDRILNRFLHRYSHGNRRPNP